MSKASDFCTSTGVRRNRNAATPPVEKHGGASRYDQRRSKHALASTPWSDNRQGFGTGTHLGS